MTSGKKARGVEADDPLAIARRYHAEGRIAEASAAYRRILGRNPADVDAMSLLGVAEGQSGRPKVAIELLSTAAKLRPADTGILVNLAKALADGGRPDDARRTLEDAIAHQPRSVDARTKLATLLLQAQRPADALAQFDAALQIDPKSAAALSGSGAALQRLGQHGPAAARFYAALQVAPGDAVTECNLAIVLLRLGKAREALQVLDASTARNASLAEAWNVRCEALRALGRPEEALASVDRALTVRSNFLGARVQRAVTLTELGRTDAALADLDSILTAVPQHAEAWCYRGIALHQAGRIDLAQQAYDRAVAIRPDYAEAWANMASLLQEQDRPQESLAAFERSLAANPNRAITLSNRGNSFVALGRLEEGMADFDGAIALQPTLEQAHYNRAIALQELRRVDEALSEFDAAIALRPGYEEANWNRALAQLLSGDFVRGWQGYEWRLRKKDTQALLRTFAQPRWDGRSNLRGKTILLYAEQGLGDTLQFCRYAPLVAQRGANVVLEVQTPLQSLLARMPGVSVVVPAGSPLPAFDVQGSLLSMPLAFGTTLQTIPAAVPYLAPDRALVALWAGRLGPRVARRIGIVWSGSATHKNDRHRSARFVDFAALTRLGADVVSLHKEVRPEEAAELAARDVHFFGNDLRTFDDTAALVENLDLVVTVDTSVAHLAGAMGKPVWILVPYAGIDFRWLLDRDDSPWYPTARLFRQQRDEPWANVVERVAKALRERRSN